MTFLQDLSSSLLSHLSHEKYGKKGENRYKYKNPDMLQKRLDHKSAFVFFGANWCGYCKRAEPFVKALHQKYPYAVVKGDCTANNSPIASKYNISSFPTLILFQNGSKIEYKGDRDVESMERFLKTHKVI
tara:strand:- start:182 stop:571 length:390 start_codon:yes stop_codon:yes gene_type:complete